jgi:hypothetical protein
MFDNEDDAPLPPGYEEADTYAEECAAAADLEAWNKADLRRAKELCAMGCDDADVNGWPARLHVALNVFGAVRPDGRLFFSLMRGCPIRTPNVRHKSLTLARACLSSPALRTGS